MKHSSTWLYLLMLLSVLLLAACDFQPDALATVASTAALPDTTAETTPQPPDATTAASPLAETPDAPPAPVELDATEVAATEVAYAAIVILQASPTPTNDTIPTPSPPPTYTYRVVNTYPHDPSAFTQGLVLYEDALYEGTGRWGESTVREVALETGAVVRSRALEAQFFGEGITVLDDKVYQLTWQEQTGFVYDHETFEPIQTFSYPTEGWGITHDGRQLIVSDGTSTLYFWDAETLQETGRVTVRDHLGPVNRLNELEFVNGEIWANVWLTNLIARISPETGDVLGYIDLTGLLDTAALTQPADVLNGIAYDADTERLFVTGKLWPSLFEIEVVPAP